MSQTISASVIVIVFFNGSVMGSTPTIINFTA